MTLPATLSFQDASLINSNALPALSGSANEVNGTPLDSGSPSRHGASTWRRCELVLTAPALTTAQLPDGTTMSYSIVASASASLSNPVTLAGACIVQTGSGGAARRPRRSA